VLGALSVLLVVSICLLVPATLLLFTVGERGRRWPLGAREALAVGLVGLGALGVAALLRATPAQATFAAVVVAAATGCWVLALRAWATRGAVAWSLSLVAGLTYLAYVLLWTVESHLSVLSFVLSLVLLLLEAFMFLIGVGYLWEFVDVLARREWSAPLATAAPGSARPFVSIHVPCHNEPPEMVIGTLEALLALEYDDYEVLVVDNNTTDEALWRPLEAFCARHDRLRFLHLEDWPGFKSGALNEALRVTDPRAEVIGIVDADYLVDADWLAKCAPLFGAEDVAFVQTPQDYRDWTGSQYLRGLYFSYDYFFDVSQKSRNERNGAIFGGTMGLIRREALVEVGGWDEWCITEDAELSLRLLRAGDRGIHVAQAFGRGVMPLTFEALKRQRFRWCFGGIQIMRMHWRSLLPGRRTPDNRLTFAQRWAYFVGGLQWFGDLAGLLFTGFLLVGAADQLFGAGLVARRLSGLVLVAVAALVLLGTLRSLALVRRASGASWREAFGAFGLWLALGWTVAQATFRGMFAREGVFLRTPKVKGEPRPVDALRGNRFETVVALVCGAAAVGVLLHGTVAAAFIGGLLVVQSVGFAAAPLNSLAAIRADLPADLRRIRRQGLSSWGRPARRSGFVLAGAVALAVGAVVFAAPVGNPALTDLGSRTAKPKAEETVRPHRVRPSHGATSASSAGTATSAAATTGAPGATATTRGVRPTPTVAPTTAGQTRPTQAATPTQAPTTLATRKPTAAPTQAQTTRSSQVRSTPTHTAPVKPTAAPTTHPGGRP
jgi:cellulose synthase/poly-beta-1,6-N-acetylglucosamine synthase-like glycosyltransferase